MSAPPPPQTWLQFLMLEIVRHDAALTRGKENIHSLTAAIRRYLPVYPPPRSDNSNVHWVRLTGPTATTTSSTTSSTAIAERRKQFEVERLLLRQAQDHELFQLKQAQDLEILLHELERDGA